MGVIVGGYASDKLFRSERMPVVTWMSVAMCGVCLVWWLFGSTNLWLFVGCFFALNLFVGVIVDNFNRIKKENDVSATMTAEQRRRPEAHRMGCRTD